MDKIKIKYFPIKIIIIVIIQICNFKTKTKNNFINIENYYLIKSIYNITKINLYINYLNNIKFIKKINEIYIKKDISFLSICISAYNSEKYIEKAILSIINQSFQDFEIIVVNDNSIDNTSKILKKLQKEDKRIKLINHSQNLGIYHSRVEGVLNSNSEYILFLDSDDMIFNPFLFENAYKNYLKYNLDIIEYTVFYKLEFENKLYYPKDHELNHFHNYFKKIIYQPELSNILFYKPNTKIYSKIKCRTVWNKLYKKDIALKSIYYIGKSYFENYYLIVAEDTLLNIILFNFAQNYTNLNIPGYLYNLRKSSITHMEENDDFLMKKSISYFLYFQLLYRYIKEYDKDRNYFYYELQNYGLYILNLQKFNNTENYVKKAKIMFKDILNDNKATLEFKNYIYFFYDAILK